MAGSATGLLQGLLKAVFAIALLGVVLLGLFVAWWIALLMAALLILYSVFRQLLGGRRTAPTRRPTAAVIEGEYKVEREPASDSPAISGRSKDQRPPG